MPDQNKQQNIDEKSGKLKFSLLTYVLIICIIELTYGAFQNINKNINFTSKIKGLESKLNEEKMRNEQLKLEIKNFNSDVILESIARNNLKMAGEDEVLIIINKPENKESDIENVNDNNKNRVNDTRNRL